MKAPGNPRAVARPAHHAASPPKGGLRFGPLPGPSLGARETTSRPLPHLARLLAAVLVVWEPATFALTASGALSRLVMYGAPALALLVYRGLVIGLGLAAGRALWSGRSEGPWLAQIWVVGHAVAVTLTFVAPYFPSNRLPGTKWPTLVALLLLDAACWAWLHWSPAVRRAYGTSGGDGD